MTHITKARVEETANAPGTGAVTLTGAVTGYQRFGAVMAVADTCFFYIEAVDAFGVPNGGWEEGYGTYSATNTLTRTTLLSSSTGSTVSFTGAVKVSLTFPAFRAAGCDVQNATTAGANTWVNPSPTIPKLVRVRMIGSGGGAGSGRKGATSAASGGSGAGAGAIAEEWFLSTALGTTATMNVGAAGVGGTAQATDNTNGLPGTAGGLTWFGTSSTNFFLSVIGGSAGLGGTTGTTAGGGLVTGYPTTVTTYPNQGLGGGSALASGSASSGTGTVAGFRNATGGGGGGGYVSGSSTNGGDGGVQAANSVTGSGRVGATILGGKGGAVVGPVLPTDGGSAAIGNPDAGTGGGGGACLASSAQAGANGGLYGGGGGGGGGGANALFSSGKGGDGGGGIIQIVVYL